MSNSCETIERLAREAEQRKLLALARSCKDLEEFVEKLDALIGK